MHQLTIDTTTVTVTEHDNPAAAHAALHRYIVDGDYYLRPVHTADGRCRYDLLRLDDDPETAQPPRGPHVAGTATIQEISTAATYSAAWEAQRWIHVATQNESRCQLSDSYPEAVLSMAHDAATGRMTYDMLARESAALAETTDTARPDPAILEALRHNAISADTADIYPARLAAAVQHHLPAGSSESSARTLIWFYALCLWGAHR